MLKTDAHRIIDEYRVKVGDENQKHNVLSQAGIRCCAGKWEVPDSKYQKFLECIDRTLSKTADAELYFLEVPNETHNIIKVDMDLRFMATEDELKQRSPLHRRYNNELIQLMIDILASNISKMIETPDHYKIYVQDKQKPRIAHQEKQIKDGIHIIIPDLVLSNTALYYLREQIITNSELIEMLMEIGNTTDIGDVIDKRIIYPNAWYIYGCGKPDDKTDVYKVSQIYKVSRKDISKSNGEEEDDATETEDMDPEYGLTLVQGNKSRIEYINLFSNFGKKPNVEYKLEFDPDQYKNDENTKYKIKDADAIYRSYTQDHSNFRNASTLTQEEIKPYLDCLKKKRADDYEDWRRIGISLFNMDHRNYDLWNKWSRQSPKYDEATCFKAWYKEFAKAGKYNLGLNKIREYAKSDNPEKYKQIININKKNFFMRWLQAHMDEKAIHSKNVSISTITRFIHSYIKDYASFNIACALPGGMSSIYYKFDKHKWSEDKGANKIYNLLSETIKNELNNIFIDLQQKMLATQQQEQEQNLNRMRQINNGGGGDEDADSVASYQRYVRDDREAVANPEQLAADAQQKMYTKMQHDKCAAIIQYLDTPRNKKTIIEDLSQRCYDEDFYKKLDENCDVFVCNNGILDLEQCIFRDGQPSDMMTVSSNVEFPKNIDSLEAQDYMYSIQDWLDKIFPDPELQEFTLNEFACKLSGKLFGEKFIICTGSGANGKSQLFKMMKQIFGDYYQQTDNTLLNTPKRDANAASPALAVLKCKRIVVMSEPKNNQPFESDKVKELVSGDPLTCRHLNKDPIQFIPQYRMFLQCNDIPRNESTDDGFWRKIFIIPMESKFVAKEDDMYKLDDPVRYPNHFRAQDQEHLYKDWAPYFLYLLFERYKDLKAHNFKFVVPDKVKMATKQYMEEASTYTQFFNDKVEEAPGYKVEASALYEEFVRFVGRDFKTQKPTFLKQMERLIGKPKGKNKEYINIRIYGTTGDAIEGGDANAAAAVNSDAEDHIPPIPVVIEPIHNNPAPKPAPKPASNPASNPAPAQNLGKANLGSAPVINKIVIKQRK